VEAVICLPLMDVIELPWEKLVPALMRGARSLPGNRVDVRRRIECRYRLGHRNDGKSNYEWSRGRAFDLLVVIRDQLSRSNASPEMNRGKTQ